MSLATRLRNSTSEKPKKLNYKSAKKLHQVNLFGELDPMDEMVDLANPEEVLERAKIADPRPDLAEDSALWKTLLNLAQEQNPMLAGVLHGFRCQGTRIRQGKNGYVLRPDIDPVFAWPSQEDYERERDRWLKPHAEEITALLKRL